ncbi:MAG: cysteine synthase CysM [Burkholderiaceae bacterium]|nr:cysteine synthase CysM [Burkholderiaceae bacterium]
MRYQTLEDTIGNTPLVRIQRLMDAVSLKRGNVILAKLEGNNPAGSVKDRAAMNMICQAELRGEIKAGDTLIEATSGNTGIALAMAAAIKGYKMVLIMPDDLSVERRAAMTAYGAELILTPSKKSAGTAQESLVGMEYARDLAMRMQDQGKGKVLDQFSNPANPGAHMNGTGPEIWQQTQGNITHFVSAMGTTGTITGVSTYLKSKNPNIQIIGVQPQEGSQIPGIRKWPEAYLPRIYDPRKVDRLEYVSQAQCEMMARRMATQEGIFCGPSAAGAFTIALKVAQELENATIVFIVCDRGDRYLSTGIYEEKR